MTARTRLLGFAEPSDSEYDAYARQAAEQSIGVEMERENNQGFFTAFRTSFRTDTKSKNTAQGYVQDVV
eukprot:gene12206-14417_t